ncbi:response regulator transcription factor [Marinoscillum furvescens]|uniref:Response regulator receiver domain-containing protein n=1 Tax=Marinoscillum furvescens DSM 4134 TaxID=1122208 RepID=A0A3D9L1W1_MARFU|nr:response regulator [Marinoscillum furvescens]RED97087.1 response regulator receiver domain-containing protein [Marinoscillum furvescens DSM 4134]
MYQNKIGTQDANHLINHNLIAENQEAIASYLKPMSASAGKRKVLLINCNDDIAELMRRSLSDTKRYEVLSMMDEEPAFETINALNPHLITLAINKTDSDALSMIHKLKSHSVTASIPLIVFSADRLQLDAVDELLAAGVVDCISQTMEPVELRLRVKSTLLQVKALNDVRSREETIRKRHHELASKFEQLQDAVATRQREALTHLELLMHSKEVNETIMDKVNDLRPYLNVHGKAKLKQITRQMKWELNEEEELNLERKLDESNHAFYEILQEHNSELTKYEMRLCAYLKANNSSTEIARITRKTANCINVAFARVRNKLDMANNHELKAFLKSLEYEETPAVTM